MMAPFGTGNSEPLFLIRNAVSADINYMGRNQDHVRLVLERRYGPILPRPWVSAWRIACLRLAQ